MIAAVVATVSGCAPLVDYADSRLNPIDEENPAMPDDLGDHNRFLIVDLHADTLMWRRGLENKSPRQPLGQVDLARLARGNVGLQVFAMPTRVPFPSDVWRCTHARGFDPAPLLALASGWPAATGWSPYERAVVQATELQRVVDETKDRTRGIRVRRIDNVLGLEDWLRERYGRGTNDADVIGALLAVEGAHAFSSDLGTEFDSLVRKGLRMVSPTHHFTNVYGGSSEGCEQPLTGLTERGRELVRALFARNMIVDVAHGSSALLRDTVSLAAEQAKKRPVLVSHTGIREYLAAHPFEKTDQSRHAQAINRATPLEDVARVAGTGGTVGVIYWEEQIGGATARNVAGFILQALCGLVSDDGYRPEGSFHRVRDASEHVSLGSDWDGAARNAVDAAHLAAITGQLRALNLNDSDMANIMGRNACRVMAQSLSGSELSYDRAIGLCSRYQLQIPAESELARKTRHSRICRANGMSKPIMRTAP